MAGTSITTKSLVEGRYRCFSSFLKSKGLLIVHLLIVTAALWAILPRLVGQRKSGECGQKPVEAILPGDWTQANTDTR